MKKRIVCLALALMLVAAAAPTALAARFADVENTITWLDNSKIRYSVTTEHEYLGEVKLDNIWWYGKDADPYNGSFSVFVIDDSDVLDVECYFTLKNTEAFAADVGYNVGGVQLGYYDEQEDDWVDDGKLHVNSALGYPGEGTADSPFIFRFAPQSNGWTPLQSVVLIYDGVYQDEYDDYEYLGWIGFSAIVFTQSQIAHFKATGELPEMVSDWGEDIAAYTDLTPLKALLAGTAETKDEPSSWAVEAVAAAIAENLVPEQLQGKYKTAVTRAEFCAFAVALYEAVMDEEITARAAFTDTDDVNVEKMAALGVVNGMGDGIFAPDNKLNREQAATMLSRLAAAMGKPLAAHDSTFADISGVSAYAVDAVGQMQATGIMTGVGENMFSPKSDYTREQSIITIMRMFDIVK